MKKPRLPKEVLRGGRFLFVFTLCFGPRPPAAAAPPGVSAGETAPAAAAPAHPTTDFTERKATRPWRIAFIPKFKFLGETGRLSSYWQPAWVGAMKAGEDFGVTVRLVTSEVRGATEADYVEPQIRLVGDLIAHGLADGIVIAPFDSNRLAPVLEKAIAAGIPVVGLDTPVNSDQVVTFVTFDNFAAGRMLGQWVAQQLHGKGKALILDGPPHEQNAVDRRRGFLAGLGAIEILNIKSADWEIAPARQVTTDWLRQFSEVNVIMAANDNMAIGAGQAAAAARRRGILITGFDGTAEALAAIKSGQIAATVDQEPGRQARLATQLLIRHLETGEKFPATVLLPGPLLVTGDNIAQVLAQRARR